MLQNIIAHNPRLTKIIIYIHPNHDPMSLLFTIFVCYNKSDSRWQD